MRVVFAGTPPFARIAAQSLHAAGFVIPLILPQPTRPPGRVFHFRPPPSSSSAPTGASGLLTPPLSRLATNNRATRSAPHRPPLTPRTAHILRKRIVTPHSPIQVPLLGAWPAAEFYRLFPHFEPVPRPLGAALYETGGRLQHVYFPTTSIVSLLYVLEDGASAEIAVVGNEGILGISLFMGGETTPSRAIVQSAGYGYRLKAKLLKNEFNRAGPQLALSLP